jgi:8-oxo-dGTP pyrophosphatase MutT (NUDIX family)
MMHLEQIIQCLEAPLPGKDAQYRMAVTFRQNLPDLPPKYHAGVLILLYPHQEELNVVFMKRPEYNGAHSGQISLPGGRNELCDKNMKDTALRETEEELGINRQNIQLIGKLTPLYIPISETKVYPFVGYSSFKPDFKPNQREVAYLIENKLSDFFSPQNVKSQAYQSAEYSGLMPYYDIQHEKIWGATAMIISELVAVLSPCLLGKN